MNKVVNFSILILSLFALEIILDFIFLVLIDCSMYDIEFFVLKKAWRSSAVWNYWRLLFYGSPFLILKIILFQSWPKRLKVPSKRGVVGAQKSAIFDYHIKPKQPQDELLTFFSTSQSSTKKYC